MKLLQGDCLDILKTLPENSIDSLVTDPPAGISFMSKDWDADRGGRDAWIDWMSEIMSECLRVLKPGAHGLIWSIPRTSHWTGLALEKAGFEVRDIVSHLFGQGFPKSLNISKAIDKTAESMPQKQWDGWGTALKPAVEMWWLVRKPCSEKTVASNVLKWGTGGINIDKCRVSTDGKIVWKIPPSEKQASSVMIYGKPVAGSDSMFKNKGDRQGTPIGRFPANLVLSHSEYCTDEMCDIKCAVALLNAQSGFLHASGNKHISPAGQIENSIFKIGSIDGRASDYKDGGGGASRFFYCAKTSSSEKNAGLDEMQDRRGGIKNSSGRGYSERDPMKPIIVKNHHPTVKPQKLMRYLCKLITPPQGIVLDPFMGSGSTGLAALNEGFDFIGIEKEQDYFEIAQARIKNNHV